MPLTEIEIVSEIGSRVLPSWREENLIELENTSRFFFKKTDPEYIAANGLANPWEISIFQYLSDNYDAKRHHIVEVGSGYSVLGLSLALRGFMVTCIDAYELIGKGAKCLKKAVKKETGQSFECQLITGIFPSALDISRLSERDNNIVMLMDISGDISNQYKEKIIRSCVLFDELVFDPGHIGTPLRKASERQAFLTSLSGHFEPNHCIYSDPTHDYWLCNTKSPLQMPEEGFKKTTEISPPFQKMGNFGWSAQLPEALECFSDNMETPQRSNLSLFENDLSLGPAHALHETITSQGGGRFSHWRKHLIFSTSDGSDPNTNNKHYHVDY